MISRNNCTCITFYYILPNNHSKSSLLSLKIVFAYMPKIKVIETINKNHYFIYYKINQTKEKKSKHTYFLIIPPSVI